jgi:purine-binding chemotaxis protein CheW
MTALENSWVMFQLEDSIFGVPTWLVSEMSVLGETHALSESPDDVRGMTNLRGKVMPVIDMRFRLGFNSMKEQAQQLTDMLNNRYRDHVNWLNELRACMEESRPFTLERNPHKCVFGRWYDSFSTDNVQLRQELHRLKAPHERVHRLADEVTELLAQGRIEEARTRTAEVEKTDIALIRTTFESMSRLTFESIREVLLVLHDRDVYTGLVVDAITEVIQLEDSQIEPVSGISLIEPDYIHGMAKTKDQLHILLRAEKLLLHLPAE